MALLSKNNQSNQPQLTLDFLPAHVTRLYLAFSGGIDSCVLLQLLLNYRDRYELILWHINHGLQHNADEMAAFAKAQAHKYQIGFRLDTIQIEPGQGNLEARARTLRYQTFAKGLRAEDAVLTAHHMNDQAETLLLNLMRGSGVAGLSAIARQRSLGKGLLVRPMLDFSRKQIEAIALQNDLEWVEDPSNKDQGFDRNYLRHSLIPVFQDRWPAAIQQLHRVCDWQNETAALIQQLADIDLQGCVLECRFSQNSCLDVEALLNLSFERQKNLLRYWLSQQGKAVPGFKRLNELLKQLGASRDANTAIEFHDYVLQPYRGKLYIVEKDQQQSLNNEGFMRSYMLADNNEPVDIDCINLQIDRPQILRSLGEKERGQKIVLCFKDGLSSQDHQQTAHRLKRLFQNHHVPPWMRAAIPLLFIDGDLKGLWLS